MQAMQARKEYEKTAYAGAHRKFENTSVAMLGKSPRYQNQFDYHIFHV